MATSKKFSVRVVRIGRSGNDSIAIALSKDATMTISPKEGSRGILKIGNKDGAEFSVDLSGYSAGEYETIRNFKGDICNHLEHLDGIFYIAKSTSESAKGNACGSRWERDADKFALCAKFRSPGNTVGVSKDVDSVFELRSDGKLLAVISAFGISGTRLDSWIGDTSPIGKLGKLSDMDRLRLDVARQEEIVAGQLKALAASQKVLADLTAKLPKKEQKKATA